MMLPSGPRAFVTSVWHVAHTSDSRMCTPSVGWNVVAERMIVDRPRSISKGPKTGRGCAVEGALSTYPPVKLSGVPSFVLVIWWHSEQLTPSSPRGSSRLSNTLPSPPAMCAAVRDIGMWQTAHSSSIARDAAG
jgi:hypothetical protein